MLPKVPPPSPPRHRLTLLQEETPQPGMWKGISMALMRSASFSNPWDSSCRPGQPSGRSCPTWSRVGTVPRRHQGWCPAWGWLSWLPPSFPASRPPSQGFGSPPLAREQEGEQSLEERACEGDFEPGKWGCRAPWLPYNMGLFPVPLCRVWLQSPLGAHVLAMDMCVAQNI